MTHLFPEYFPGSKHPIVRNTNTSTAGLPAEESWDAKPRKYRVGGVEREFFTVGNLAQALNRSPVTIRRLEREGIIPKPPFVKSGKDGDTRGRRRLYTREHVEGLVKLAEQHAILHETWRPIPAKFTEDAVKLFRSLS